MVLVDVNVLVYAHHRGSVDHAKYLHWVEEQLASDQAFGMSDLVLSGFLRVVTNPRVFDPPTDIGSALKFVNEIRGSPNCVPVMPGARHWEIFMRLCKVAGVKGNLVPDAYFAALAIESGCQWISTDRDYARFPGLSWRHPLS